MNIEAVKITPLSLCSTSNYTYVLSLGDKQNSVSNEHKAIIDNGWQMILTNNMECFSTQLLT